MRLYDDPVIAVQPGWITAGPGVEVGDLEDCMVFVRDGKDPGGPVLKFTRDEWRAFLAGVSKGEFTHIGRP